MLNRVALLARCGKGMKTSAEACMLPIGSQEQNIYGLDENEEPFLPWLRNIVVGRHAGKLICKLWQVLKSICHDLKEKGQGFCSRCL